MLRTHVGILAVKTTGTGSGANSSVPLPRRDGRPTC